MVARQPWLGCGGRQAVGVCELRGSPELLQGRSKAPGGCTSEGDEKEPLSGFQTVLRNPGVPWRSSMGWGQEKARQEQNGGRDGFLPTLSYLRPWAPSSHVTQTGSASVSHVFE